MADAFFLLFGKTRLAAPDKRAVRQYQPGPNWSGFTHGRLGIGEAKDGKVKIVWRFAGPIQVTGSESPV
jgi:hypothetical protein